MDPFQDGRNMKVAIASVLRMIGSQYLISTRCISLMLILGS